MLDCREGNVILGLVNLICLPLLAGLCHSAWGGWAMGNVTWHGQVFGTNVRRPWHLWWRQGGSWRAPNATVYPRLRRWLTCSPPDPRSRCHSCLKASGIAWHTQGTITKYIWAEQGNLHTMLVQLVSLGHCYANLLNPKCMSLKQLHQDYQVFKLKKWCNLYYLW